MSSRPLRGDCRILIFLTLLATCIQTGTANGQSGSTNKSAPPSTVQIDPAFQQGIEQWQKSREENQKAFERIAPNAQAFPQTNAGPQDVPSPMARGYDDIVNMIFVIAGIVGAMAVLWLALNLYNRARAPATARDLAISDPWIRARLAQRDTVKPTDSGQ